MLIQGIFHIYDTPWGGYNELASVNGASITTDALGRMVENVNGAQQSFIRDGWTTVSDDSRRFRDCDWS
jgi:hypothetical protein